MSIPDKIDAHQKALSLNLDATAFGSFAEIGAGQEVARWFLRVGGASGTVAKTISAYDKEVSDDLYGSGTRYVSQPRLLAMLDNEWAQLLSQLNATRGAKTRFFSFVDTISARNFAGSNECHGWLGVRFQTQPLSEASEVVLHVNLQDTSNLHQQEAVGILGVNLIYAVFHQLGSPEEFLKSVAEDLPLSRIDGDRAPLGELVGVAHEVEQRLPQPHRVGMQRPDRSLAMDREPVSVLCCQRLNGFGDAFDEGREREIFELQLHAPSLDFGEVEDVVDQGEQVSAGAEHAVERFQRHPPF